MSILQTGQQSTKRVLRLSNYDSQKEQNQNMDQNNDPSKQSLIQLNQNQEKLILNLENNKNNGSQFTHTEYTEKQREINLIGKQKKIFKDTFFDKYANKKIDIQDQNQNQSDIKQGKKPQRKQRGNPNLKRGGGRGGRGGRRSGGGGGRARKQKQVKEVILDDSKENQNQNGDSNPQKNGKRGRWKRKKLFSLKRTAKKKEMDQSDYQILHIQSVQLIPKRKRQEPKRNQNKLIQIESSSRQEIEKICQKNCNLNPISSYSSTQNQYFETRLQMDDNQKCLLLYLMEKTTGFNGILSQMIFFRNSYQDLNSYFKQNRERIYQLCQSFCDFYKQNPSAIKEIKVQNFQYGQHIKGLIKNYIKNQKRQFVNKELSSQKFYQEKNVHQKGVKTNGSAKVNLIYSNSPASAPQSQLIQKKTNKISSEQKSKQINVQQSDIQESVKEECE